MKLRIFTKGKGLKVTPENNKLVELVDEKEATPMIYDKYSKTISMESLRNFGLDDGAGTRLIKAYTLIKDNQHQRMSIDFIDQNKGTFKIKNSNNLCLEYKDHLIFEECNGSDNQIFSTTAEATKKAAPVIMEAKVRPEPINNQSHYNNHNENSNNHNNIHKDNSKPFDIYDKNKMNQLPFYDKPKKLSDLIKIKPKKVDEPKLTNPFSDKLKQPQRRMRQMENRNENTHQEKPKQEKPRFNVRTAMDNLFNRLLPKDKKLQINGHSDKLGILEKDKDIKPAKFNKNDDKRNSLLNENVPGATPNDSARKSPDGHKTEQNIRLKPTEGMNPSKVYEDQIARALNKKEEKKDSFKPKDLTKDELEKMLKGMIEDTVDEMTDDYFKTNNENPNLIDHIKNTINKARSDNVKNQLKKHNDKKRNENVAAPLLLDTAPRGSEPIYSGRNRMQDDIDRLRPYEERLIDAIEHADLRHQEYTDKKNEIESNK